jgi:heme-degrading monooxygenase HmoA
MATTVIDAKSRCATGINVFKLPPERHGELLKALHAINEVILRQRLSMIVASNFHVAIGAPVVINYNQYTDRTQGQVLRTVADAVPLVKLTHDLSDAHEIRWYQVGDVVTPPSAGGKIEIAKGKGVAAIGIFVAKPGKQDELLAVLKSHGEALKAAPGFLGIATHRGHKPEFVASYEKWRSAEDCANAETPAPVAERIRALTDAAERHTHNVVEVARFDLQQIEAAES